MGSGGGKNYDAVYNAEMAEIAKNTFALSEKAFNSWDSGGARELEESTAQAGMTLLPKQTELEGANLDFATKTIGQKSGISDRFYDQLGNISEEDAVARASTDVAESVTDYKANAIRDAGRRGVSYKPGGLGLNAAKLNIGAITEARETTRARNLNELATGLQL